MVIYRQSSFPIIMFRSLIHRKPRETFVEKTDAQLIRAFVDNNSTADFGTLFERYTHLVFGVCMKYLQNQQEAEDAVMDIFEKLMKDLKTHEVRDFKNWLYRVSKNHCLMALRKRSVKYRHEDEIEKEKQQEFMEIIDLGHHLYEEEEKAGILISLHNAMQSLKDEQRLCLEMMYKEKRTYREIADITGYSMNEVKSHIQNGKRNLKNKLGAK